jgi:hypothetical protein
MARSYIALAVCARAPAADERLGAAGGEGLVRYPIATLYGDYLRAAFGLVLTAGPLLVLELTHGVALVLAALGLLFAWFGARTVLRHLSRFELSPEAIALRGPLARRVAWADLERIKLAYYAPRRAHDRGWLQLELRSIDRGRIQLDSTLAGFDQVLEQASRAARAKALPLDPATQANLAALGLGSEGETGLPFSAPGRVPADAALRGGSTARW